MTFVKPPYMDPTRRSIEERSKSYDSTKLHEDDDLDSGPLAHHHTLGRGPSQAAPGSDLTALEDRIALLEGMLNTPPVDFRGNFNNVTGGISDIPGVTISSDFTLGTNFVLKQGYMASMYFNVAPNSNIAGSTTGDIANIIIIDNLPEDLRGVLNDPLYHSVNGPESHATSGADHLVLNDDGIYLTAMPGGTAWNAGSSKAFSCSYLTRTWGWNL